MRFLSGLTAILTTNFSAHETLFALNKVKPSSSVG